MDARVIGRNAAKQWLRGVKDRARDLRPVWPAILGVIYQNEMQVFDAEGAVDGEPRWPELSDKPIRFHHGTFKIGRSRQSGKTISVKYKKMGYKTWKRLTHPQKKIMRLSDKLHKQVTGQTQDGYYRGFRTKMVFGTNYPDYTDVPDRPRSPRDRLTGDQGGILDSGRPKKRYNRRGRGGQYPMEPRTIFRITQANADAMADLIIDHITQTRV